VSDAVGAAAREAIARLVVDVPDFPEPGVLFKDITPLLADPRALAAVVDALAETGRDASGTTCVDVVVGLEARGFIFAVPVAMALGVGFVPIRKAGKLPRSTHQVSYSLEYGEAALEVHVDALQPGARVLVVDDVLATGGTLTAARRLIESCGAQVAAVALLMELSFLDGRAVVADLPVQSIVTI